MFFFFSRWKKENFHENNFLSGFFIEWKKKTFFKSFSLCEIKSLKNQVCFSHMLLMKKGKHLNCSFHFHLTNGNHLNWLENFLMGNFSLNKREKTTCFISSLCSTNGNFCFIFSHITSWEFSFFCLISQFPFIFSSLGLTRWIKKPEESWKKNPEN